MEDLTPDSAETCNLLERVRAGDQDAFNRLFARHRAELRRFVELRLDRKLRRRLDASDVVQETQLEAASRLPDFLQRYNDRFQRKPKDRRSAYRRAPKASQLNQILCLKYHRVVANNHTVSLGGKTLDLGRCHGKSHARKRIIVQVALDGKISFWHRGERIGTGPQIHGELRCDPSLLAAQLPSQPTTKEPLDPPPLQVSPKPRESSAYKPPPDHPWRRPIRPDRRPVL